METHCIWRPWCRKMPAFTSAKPLFHASEWPRRKWRWLWMVRGLGTGWCTVGMEVDLACMWQGLIAFLSFFRATYYQHRTKSADGGGGQSTARMFGGEYSTSRQDCKCLKSPLPFSICVYKLIPLIHGFLIHGLDSLPITSPNRRATRTLLEVVGQGCPNFQLTGSWISNEVLQSVKWEAALSEISSST